MRFLFDQSADFRLIPHLRSLGHDVEAVSRDYPAGLSDEKVVAIALRERRTIIASDLDFGELIVRNGLQHAGVILMRLPGAALATKVARLEFLLQHHAHDLVHLVVVTESDVRVRRVPNE